MHLTGDITAYDLDFVMFKRGIMNCCLNFYMSTQPINIALKLNVYLETLFEVSLDH